VTLYLAYETTGLSQKEIGVVFGVGRYAASKAALGLRGRLQHHPRLGRLVEKLHATLVSQSR